MCPYLLDLGFDCCYCDPSLPWVLRGASPWLCGCHCPVCGGICSLVGGVEPPDLFLRCDSDLWSRQLGLEHTHWERSHQGLLLWGCAPWGVLTCCESHVTPCWHCSWPPPTMGMLAHCSGVSQRLFSLEHQHRSSELRSQNCIHGAGPTVVLWGQLRLWPGPTP